MKGKILVAEGNQDYRVMLCDFLRDEGYDVSETADGIAGLARLIDDNFDVCIIGGELQRMNGVELLAKAQYNGAYKIFNTSRFDFLQTVREKQLADVAVLKPYSIYELREQIDIGMQIKEAELIAEEYV